MIKNGKDISLSQTSGTLPNVSGAMDGWFQAMTFIILNKTTVNYKLKVTETIKNFRGVWQSLTGQALSVKPEGQRGWKWYQVHSDVDLSLILDDVIKFQGKEYKVMTRIDQSLYGYYEYHLVENYEK